jgi:hypothetical protein
MEWEILKKELPAMREILDAEPGKVYTSPSAETLTILMRRMEESDLKEAMKIYCSVFGKTKGAEIPDLVRSADAYLQILNLAEAKAVNFDGRTLRKLLQTYHTQIVRTGNVLHLTQVQQIAGDPVKQEALDRMTEKHEAFVAFLKEQSEKLEDRLGREAKAFGEGTADAESDEEKDLREPGKKEREGKEPVGLHLPKAVTDLIGKIRKFLEERFRRQQMEAGAMEQEKARARTRCREIPCYEKKVSVTWQAACKDIPEFSLMKRKSRTYFGWTRNLRKNTYDNGDQSLVELTEVTNDFLQYMTTDLLGGDYQLKPFIREEKAALQTYFEFVCACFEKHIGKGLNVQEYLHFKTYYNRLVLTMMQLEENFRKKYYRALVLSDNYRTYMNCYDLEIPDEKKRIISNIMEGQTTSYQEDLELILENHLVDAEAQDKVRELMNRLKNFDEKDGQTGREDDSSEMRSADKETSEENRSEASASGKAGAAGNRSQVGLPAAGSMGDVQTVSMEMLTGKVPVKKPVKKEYIVRFLDEDGKIRDEATYSENNQETAMEEFLQRQEDRKQLIRKIGDQETILMERRKDEA